METISRIITIKGDKVQGIGYRPFLYAKALRLRIPNFDARNEEEKEDGKQSVIICISGQEKQITDFVKFVESKKPKNAKVDSITDELLVLEDIISTKEYGKILNVEQTNNIVQGGQKIDKDLNTLRTDTNENFKRMDTKYDAISKGMFAVVDIIEKRNQTFEKRLENTEKNIEKLLEILIDKKNK